MIQFVYAQNTHRVDGIRSFAEHCSEALRTHLGAEVALELWDRTHAPATVGPGDVVLVQYNPFSYGRRGFAPWLVRRLRAIRHSEPRAQIVLVVHEAHVPPRSLKWIVMGGWQKAQLAWAGRLSDAVVVSTEAWRAVVTRLTGRPPLAAIPVGSNLPDFTAVREQARRARGWSSDTFVVAALGADQAARRSGLAMAALKAIGQFHPKIVLANLGTAPLAGPLPPGAFHHHAPGFLSDEALAEELAAADLFLAPYEDGVSMRRTTLAAALQHALPVVGTDGRNTESELRGTRAMRLATPDATAFAGVAREVASDEGVRSELRRQARAFFDRRLSWPAIADQYGAALEALVARTRD